MTRCSIRPAAPRDAAALLALIQAHAVFEGSQASLTATELDRLLDGDEPRMSLFVAAQHDELAGYAALSFDYALWRGRVWAHLDCLYVVPALRGHGIGAAILRHVSAHAQRAGADRLEWQTPAWNARAIAFYRREGAHAAAKMRFVMPL